MRLCQFLLFSGCCLSLSSSSAAPLAPPSEKPTASTRTERGAAKDYDEHIRQLQRRLADEELHYVVEAPFVVVGNGSEAEVRRWATGTIRWAVDRLKASYFEREPTRILTIWLLKDKASYERLNQKLFGKKPGTPFGYYSSHDDALVMNISTGGGTLVHEIVHPFVEANFRDCPAWFNEGLGSLYEQCGDREGKITGYTNWRLAGLQRAIRADAVPTFRTLCATSNAEFYHADPGTNYAQARYLCYYLQERGLLRAFYRRFHQNHRRDPSGYASLVAVLGNPDMEEFESDWRKFVLKLKFP
ncbi:MAG: hypothetical protein KDA42_12085 [Planctomycetales bacterium]|nr:hypothetical protein [Planctomycetales bacterium]